MFQTIWHWISDPFQYEFMVKALGVGVLVGVICAVLSCFITLKGWSLMGDAVSHAVLPGVVLAYLAGIPFGIGAFIFGLGSVLLIGWVRANTRLRDDAVIGIVFTAFFGLGLILMSKIPSLAEWINATFGYLPPLLDVKSILFGNVLGISNTDILQTVIVGGVTLTLVLVFRRDLLLFCFDPNHARAIGLNTNLLYYMLLSLLALTIVAALQTIGIVLVVAMLVTPGAIAYTLTNRFDRMLLIAGSASVFSCVVGIYASYYLNASTGGCIVFTQALVFLVALALAPQRGLLARALAKQARKQTNEQQRQSKRAGLPEASSEGKEAPSCSI
jgi:manganese transport system permease protein